MMIMNISDQYLLRYFKGLEETGLYALSYKFGMAINLFITGFRFAWVPFIFRVSGEPGSEKMYARAFEITVVILGLLYFLICTFLPEIFLLLVDSSYYGGMGIVPMVAFSYILFGLHIIFLAGIYLEDETPYIAKVGLTSALVNVISNLFFIPRYGMWGAAATTLASFSILIVLIYRKAQAVHRIPFDISLAAKVLLYAVLLMSGVRLIELDEPLLIFGMKLIALALYLMILRSMGLVRKEKLREVLSWVKKEPAS
jgi:O-antigen/teichoic acid export membrane protein